MQQSMGSGLPASRFAVRVVDVPWLGIVSDSTKENVQCYMRRKGTARSILAVSEARQIGTCESGC
jgi:hypothetical protein